MAGSKAASASLGLEDGHVSLRPHDPSWLAAGARERATLARVLEGLAVGVEHVGSTAVPGLEAKPILDLAVALRSWDASELAELRRRLEDAGYGYRQSGADGGLLFVRAQGPVRTAHVHVLPVQDPEWERYLTFRDRLRADPGLRADYAALKRRLARIHPTDRVAYTEAKTEFVLRALAQGEVRP